MFTVMHNPTRGVGHPGRPESTGDKKLRHERVTAIIAISIMLALILVVLWLASLGGANVEPIESWPMLF